MENLPENSTNINKHSEFSKENGSDNDIFYCPICRQPNQKTQKTFFCIQCGHKFPVDENNQLILDENNFSIIEKSKMKKNLPKNKKRNWRLLTGITISFGSYILVEIASFFIYFGLSIFTDMDSSSIPFQFFISISSLLFFIIPLLWIQRYYPGQLSFKQRLSELGLPLHRYSKNELIREILLGIFLGLFGIFLVFLLQFCSFYLIKLIYHIDIYNFLEAINFEDFNLAIPENSGDLILFLLMMILFIGIPEEIMFRGFVQRSFENNLSKSAALTLTAVYFALYHIFLYILQPIIFFFLVIPYIGLSLLLGLIRNWRGDIIASIITHIIYNSTQTFIIFIILNSI